jgi:MYXO-CTERM domain-containing protein
MGAVVVAALVLAPALALAEIPRRAIVWKNQIRQRAPGAAVTVSNKLYLNDCRPNGCTVTPGNDDSRTNRSSIPQSVARLDAWNHGDAAWNDLVACVKDTFLPFQIEVVTTDPGTASHFEVMVGGSSAQLSPDLVAGGVAPFLGCNASDDNVISFVFAGTSNDPEFLCGAVAQEACHVWGLDHELNALDPMTYLDLGSRKRFQNDDARCGEELASPRSCYCGGTTQNSYEYMTQTFGAANLPPPTLAIATPTEGQWVKPGFAIRAELTSVLGARSAALTIDGVEVSSLSPGPFGFNAPTTIIGGDHTIAIVGTDGGARTVSESVNVHVTGACSASGTCSSGLHCLGGFCLPGSDVEGGLGAACTGNAACITNSCGTARDQQLCTAPCDDGGACPGGFECLGANSDAGVCWPIVDEGGCAATPGSSSPAFVLVGFGFLALIVRRRR